MCFVLLTSIVGFPSVDCLVVMRLCWLLCTYYHVLYRDAGMKPQSNDDVQTCMKKCVAVKHLNVEGRFRPVKTVCFLHSGRRQISWGGNFWAITSDCQWPMTARFCIFLVYGSKNVFSVQFSPVAGKWSKMTKLFLISSWEHCEKETFFYFKSLKKSLLNLVYVASFIEQFSTSFSFKSLNSCRGSGNTKKTDFHQKDIKTVLVRFRIDLLACNQVENNDLCCQGSKNEWIPSKSILENYIQIYFTIFGTKQITINCQNR